MKLIIDENWTFNEAVQAAFSNYTGYGITSKGYRNNMLKSWGNVVKKERAIEEFNKYVMECSGIEEATETMMVKLSTLKKLQRFYGKLPSRKTL